MRCFKLVTQGLKAYGGFRYTLGEWTPLLAGDARLCNSCWYHVYDHPLIAVLLNPTHRDLARPKLFECTYDGRLCTLDNQGLKRGVRRLRLDKELPLPVITSNQRTRVAIYCAKPSCSEKHWRAWAKSWLNGKDRTSSSAMQIQRMLGRGLRASNTRPVRTAHRCALAAADTAKQHVDGSIGHMNWRAYNWGAWSTTGAIKYAANFAMLTEKSRNAAYWVRLIETAITDENKFQEEHAST